MLSKYFHARIGIGWGGGGVQRSPCDFLTIQNAFTFIVRAVKLVSQKSAVPGVLSNVA